VDEQLPGQYGCIKVRYRRYICSIKGLMSCENMSVMEMETAENEDC
jgi:hypothetical protein